MRTRKTRTPLSPAAKERLIKKAAMGNVRLTDLQMEFGISTAYVRSLVKSAGIDIDQGWTVPADQAQVVDPRAQALEEFEVALQLLNEAAAKLGLSALPTPTSSHTPD